jgi:hypothetical protein
LIVLLLILPVTLSLKLDESGRLRLKLHVLGIPLYRSPKKQKRVRLSHYSKRAMAKRKKKEERRLAAKQQKQKEKAEQPSDDETKPAKPSDDAPLTDKIAFITDLAGVILRRSFSHARVRVDCLTVTVGSSDAATTAILCGVISPALAFLLETLEQFSHLHISPNAPIGVAPDFTSEHTQADIRLHFRLHVLHLLDIALHTLIRILRHSMRKSKH